MLAAVRTIMEVQGPVIAEKLCAQNTLLTMYASIKNEVRSIRGKHYLTKLSLCLQKLRTSTALAHGGNLCHP